MVHINDQLSVVIRASGERTETICKELILAQGISPDNLVVIREAPFSAAVRKGFEIGIERGLPWTLHVDADVLLRPGSIKKMLSLAEAQEDNVFQVQGKVIDKFFGGPRDAGNHLYRTSLLSAALPLIPEEGVDIRPESHTLDAMEAVGYPTIKVPYIVGVHDFEQYYKDIFRKSFVQAHKHLYRAELFVTIWQEGAERDTDFQVALKGFAAGIEHYGSVFIDARQKEYQDGFAKLQTEETPDLAADSYSLDDIEKIINNWMDHGIYRKFFPTRAGLDPEKPAFFSKENLGGLYRALGPLKILPYLAGSVLCEMGKRIKGWAKR